MRSRKLLALLLCLITFPALAGYMTLLGAGVGSIAPTVSWIAGTDAFPDTALTYSGPSLSTMFDSSGKLTYKPNNLALNTATLGTQSVTVQVGINYLINFASGGGSIALSGAGAGTVTSASPVKITASTTTLTLTVTGTVTNAVVAAVTYETSPRTVDQVITTASAYYGPRIDYDPNTLAVRGLLIEEARTNIIPANVNSGTMTSAGWITFNATATANFAAGIDGTSNADKFAESASNGNQARYYTISAVKTANAVYTFSAFLKQGTQRYAYLTIGGGAGADWVNAVFDLQAGTVTQSSAGAAGTLSGATITASANGFYRVTVSGSMAATNGFNYIGLSNTGTPTLGIFGLPTYVGNTANYVLFAGEQFELGAFASSYIPGNGASVTRAADVVQFTGAALTALQGSAGSAIVESASIASASPASITNIIRGTNSILYRDTTGKTGTTNGTTALLTAAAPTWNAALRNGLAWSTVGRSITYTSGAVATDANAASNGGTLYLGSSNGSAVEDGWYKSFAIYNQRLPDATLQAKSVVGASYVANNNGVRFAFANDNLPVHWRIAL